MNAGPPWVTQHLRAGADALQALLDALPDGLLLLDEAGTVLEAGAACCRMLGLPREALLGSDIAERLAPGDRDAALAALAAARRAGSGGVDTRLERGDGTPLAVEITLAGSADFPRLLFASLRDGSARRDAAQRQEFLASHDELTGLPNRRALLGQVERTLSVARRQCFGVALCCLDLDAFARVNERCGVEAGDALLRRVAQTLSAALRDTDIAAHLGGDEFALLMVGLRDAAQLEQSVRRVLDGISHLAPEVLDEPLTASAGMTLFPDDDAAPEILLRNAQQALYLAKQGGGDCCRRYEVPPLPRGGAAPDVPGEIERAIRDSELQLHFQPRVDLAGGDVVGMQALVRWQHPERGLLSPVDFLFPLRGTRHEIDLETWILRAGVAQYRHWRRQGLELPVSINVGPRFFQHPAFLKTLRELADGDGGPPRLELELLEVASLEHAAGVGDTMQACGELGASFGLDDFGNGYASLTYYHRLPIEILKIPRQFVRNMLLKGHDQDIVEGVMRLAATLDLPVVAEGVESAEIAYQVYRMGCTLAQGYGIARPMPGEAVSPWIERWRAGDLCAELQAHAGMAVEDPILDVALFSHYRWHDAMQTALAGDPAAERGAVEADNGALGIWFRGVGRERFGASAQFRELQYAWEALQGLARRLLAAADGADPAAAATGMLELEDRSREFMRALLALRPAG